MVVSREILVELLNRVLQYNLRAGMSLSAALAEMEPLREQGTAFWFHEQGGLLTRRRADMARSHWVRLRRRSPQEGGLIEWT